MALSSFDAAKIKELKYKKRDGGYKEEFITVHLFLDYLPYYEAKVDDIISSNENYFKRLGFLGQENERLVQENRRLEQENESLRRALPTPGYVTPMGMLPYAYAPSPSPSPFDPSQLQVHEGRYSSGWGSTDKIVHVFLGRLPYSGKVQTDDIIASNENYFRRFKELEEQNKRLNQDNGRLEGELSTFTETKAKLERDLIVLRTNGDALTASAYQKDQELSLLQTRLQQSSETLQVLERLAQESGEEARKRDRENQTLSQRLKEEGINLERERRTHATELIEQKRSFEDQIRRGTAIVEDLQQQVEKFKLQLRENAGNLEERVEQLKRRHVADLDQEKIKVESLMKQGIARLEKVDGERAVAVEALDKYQRAVRRVLGSERGFLERIEAEVGT
jgi:cell division septum initiation protein DivIVA